MNISRISSPSFKGTLDISGYEYHKNKQGTKVLKPTRKLIDTDSVKFIRHNDEDKISITYKHENEYQTIYLPSRSYDTEYYNLVLNAFTAASQNKDVCVSLPSKRVAKFTI